MTIQDKKTVKALRDYWKYLTIRLSAIKLEIIQVSDAEFFRICKVRSFYLKLFLEDPKFKTWLLTLPHYQGHGTMNDIKFSARAKELKNKILEFEK